MKIAILTLGTRGDVQPFLALAKGLIDRGHQVRLAAPENFRTWVSGHDVAFHSLGVDFESLLQSPEMRGVLAGNWLRVAGIWRERIIPLVKSSLDATASAARDAELLVFHPKAIGVPDVAEATGARAICAAPLPMVSTAQFPLWLFPRSYGRVLNRASWQVLRSARALYAGPLNDWRRQSLGLRKGRSFARVGDLHNGRALQLCAVSPSILPRPTDWDDNAHMVGYWFLDEGREKPLDPALVQFLRAGDPPIYVGLGSMPTTDPEQLASQFIDACRQAGCRVLLARGWGGLKELGSSDDVHAIDSVPHDAVFPHVRAVIHHGGAGTTAYGLRAGTPTLIFPQIADQPFWGKRVAALGCGPEPLRRRELDRAVLAKRVHDLIRNDSYRTRACTVAEAIAREDGVGTAIRLIEQAAPRRSLQ